MVERGARPLVLVMHSDFIDYLVKALLQLPHAADGFFAHDNCSLTEVNPSFEPRGNNLKRLEDFHLEAKARIWL